MNRVITPTHEFLSDGVSVWVTDKNGNTLGRFGRRGIDIHNDPEVSSNHCLFCTHEKTTEEQYTIFRQKMFALHGVRIPDSAKPKSFSVKK